MELLEALKATKKTKSDPFHRAGPQVANGVSDSVRAAWFEICDEFDEEKGGTAASWFYPCVLREESGSVNLDAPGNGFMRDWIAKHYFRRLDMSFQQRGFKFVGVMTDKFDKAARF
jgi:hypothetical protein